MSTVNTICPVCGYTELEVPADPGETCPRFETDFGYSDFSNEEMRMR